ncbi:MAG TPA: isochorismatase family cysteine hydrolase [Lichenihabitans sp.]|nr:isochorismatase family cysteine hydrolase [Lichenihabitans sp.]
MQARRLATLLIAAFASSSAFAATVIDDWANVKVPPPPILKPITVDPRTSALLLLDFNGHDDATSGPCNKATKPRCLASIPKVRELLDKARAKGVFVVYSITPNSSPSDIQPQIAPVSGDPVVKSGADKFVDTNLGELLAQKGIKTVIVTGTASEGAVLDTGTDAALHGMNIVVPVDGMSSTELYAEQYVAWHLTHAPGVSQKTTLTRIDMIGF